MIRCQSTRVRSFLDFRYFADHRSKLLLSGMNLLKLAYFCFNLWHFSIIELLWLLLAHDSSLAITLSQLLNVLLLHCWIILTLKTIYRTSSWLILRILIVLCIVMHNLYLLIGAIQNLIITSWHFQGFYKHRCILFHTWWAAKSRWGFRRSVPSLQCIVYLWTLSIWRRMSQH